MKVTCKCHGVSGSCSLITCWQQLAPFRKVGDHLEEKYGRSTRVKTTRSGRLRVRRKAKNVPTANDLVFLERSPNYCHANDTIGSLGMFILAIFFQDGLLSSKIFAIAWRTKQIDLSIFLSGFKGRASFLSAH